ncbi:MAG: gamma-glutamyl-gamma-aminobutyrate hydrolase family protein, partial [Steroidobacteraceae bacterium]
GLSDHRERKDDPVDLQYGPAHEVQLVEGGLLRRLAGQGSVRVNSLHGQGVQRLGDRLVVEAVAPDGLVEAFRVEGAAGFLVWRVKMLGWSFRVEGAAGFALAVQWHPEWKAAENEFSTALFAAFGAAARERSRGVQS